MIPNASKLRPSCWKRPRHGEEELAGHVASSMLALVRRSGFREYFDPFTGAGYGSDRFGWSAALIVDLIERRRSAKGAA